MRRLIALFLMLLLASCANIDWVSSDPVTSSSSGGNKSVSVPTSDNRSLKKDPTATNPAFDNYQYNHYDMPRQRYEESLQYKKQSNNK